MLLLVVFQGLLIGRSHDLRRLHHEGRVLETVLLPVPHLGALVVDRAEFAGLAVAGVAHIDTKLHLEVMEGLFGAVLMMQNVGDTHAAVAPADVSTQIQALVVARDVAGLAFAAGTLRAGLRFRVCELIQKVLLCIVCLAIVVVH